ncbi:MAG: hypothetical protein ABSG63_08890 [Spirochaetia bacterium]
MGTNRHPGPFTPLLIGTFDDDFEPPYRVCRVPTKYAGRNRSADLGLPGR